MSVLSNFHLSGDCELNFRFNKVMTWKAYLFPKNIFSSNLDHFQSQSKFRLKTRLVLKAFPNELIQFYKSSNVMLVVIVSSFLDSEGKRD